MPANQWELRADVRPLERAVVRWSDLGNLVAQRADEIVDAARHELEGWNAAAAESYETHLRQVIANLDQFTTLAGEIAGSLRALGSMVASSQEELDQSWIHVSMVPHEVVGASRYLVLHPVADADRDLVRRCESEADEIRWRLSLSMEQESARLRTVRGELSLVRTTLVGLAAGVFGSGTELGAWESGAGIIAPAPSPVIGTAESGIAVGPSPTIPVTATTPHLSGLTSAVGVVTGIGSAARGPAGRREETRRDAVDTSPTAGGMAAGGAMRGGSAVRGGSARGGGSAGRRTVGGSARGAAPRLAGAPEEESARLVREKSAAGRDSDNEAKRSAIGTRRSERAARKAERRDEKDDDAADRDEVTPGEQLRDERL